MSASLSAMTDQDEGKWLTREQAAETLGLSVKRVDQLRSAGVLKSERNPATGRVHVSRASVERELRERVPRCEP